MNLGDPEAMLHLAAARRSGEHVPRSLYHAHDLLLRVQLLPRLTDELQHWLSDELQRLVAGLRADITPQLITAVSTGLDQPRLDRHLNDISLLAQALGPPPERAQSPWSVRGELAERGLAAIKLFGEVVPALRTAPDRLAPAVRDELLRLLPDLDLSLFRCSPARPLRAPESTPVRASPKVGRNDPCPCGSGRKYKRCCGTAA